MERVVPGDFHVFWEDTVYVDGVMYPTALMQPTAAFQATGKRKRRCPRDREPPCPLGRNCRDVHFKPVRVRGAGVVSAGNYEPTAGLLHFTLKTTREGWICRDHNFDGRPCPRGRNCSFLHTAEEDMSDPDADDGPDALAAAHADPTAGVGASSALGPLLGLAVADGPVEPDREALNTGLAAVAAALKSAESSTSSRAALLLVLPRLLAGAVRHPTIADVAASVPGVFTPQLVGLVLDRVTEQAPSPVDTALVLALVDVLGRLLSGPRARDIAEGVTLPGLLMVNAVGHDLQASPTALQAVAVVAMAHCQDHVSYDRSVKDFIARALPLDDLSKFQTRCAAFLQRLDRIRSTVEGLPPHIAPWTSLLLQLEHHAQRWARRCTPIRGCAVSLDGSAPSRPALQKLSPPPGHEAELWLELTPNTAETLAFTQWTPAVVPGMRAFLTHPDDAAKVVAVAIVRVQTHSLVLRSTEQPSWLAGTSKVTVFLDFDTAATDALLAAARHPDSLAFQRQLTSDGDRLRPALPVAAAATVDDDQCSLELDDTQVSFVASVLRRPRLAVVIGPPGTGKTHSVVAAMEQVVNLRQGRVLACATTTYAANVLAFFSRDLGVDAFRVFPPSLKPLDIRDSPYAKLLGCCNPVVCPRTGQVITDPRRFELDSVFAPVSGHDLARHPIVVTTTADAALLSDSGLQFDFVFVDECAQGSVPEALVPLSLAGAGATVVLSGDPMQLGPALCSTVADDLGLSNSLLHRYCTEMADPASGVELTVLRRCYRCHEDIVSLFSHAFYRRGLECCAKNVPVVHNPFAPGHSAVFIDVPHTEGSPRPDESAEEARVIVALLVTLLRANGHDRDLAGRVGVITPFRNQVLAIQLALFHAVQSGALGLLQARRVLVGTVDQFQGQERAVVLVSMVQSVRHPALPGSKLMRGFIGNRQMSNVALSRPEALLAIAGDRGGILQQPDDEVWREIITTLQARGAVLDATQITSQ